MILSLLIIVAGIVGVFWAVRRAGQGKPLASKPVILVFSILYILGVLYVLIWQ